MLKQLWCPETIHTAISAAETGHLVIATLHTRGAVNAIDRETAMHHADHPEQLDRMLGGR